MARNFERNQPVLLQPANPEAAAPRPAPQAVRPAPSRFGLAAFSFAAVVSAFWIGIWAAYLWGYLGPLGLASLSLQQGALFGAAILLPPLFFVAIAAALTRGDAMARAAIALQLSADRLFSADENASRTAARLGRAVRH